VHWMLFGDENFPWGQILHNRWAASSLYSPALQGIQLNLGGLKSPEVFVGITSLSVKL